MRCDVCREPVQDKRNHRHTRDREEIQVAEAYGRLIAEQERELWRQMAKRTTRL